MTAPFVETAVNRDAWWERCDDMRLSQVTGSEKRVDGHIIVFTIDDCAFHDGTLRPSPRSIFHTRPSNRKTVTGRRVYVCVCVQDHYESACPGW